MNLGKQTGQMIELEPISGAPEAVEASVPEQPTPVLDALVAEYRENETPLPPVAEHERVEA